MIQRGDSAGLALEALAKLFGADLDGDHPVEPRVARFVHFAHAARANGRKDLVRAESSSTGESHNLTASQVSSSAQPGTARNPTLRLRLCSSKTASHRRLRRNACQSSR